MKKQATIHGLCGFPLVKPGDDIVDLILSRARALHIRILDGDIVVVGHKVVSKSEGRIVQLSKVKVSSRAIRIGRKSLKDPRLVQLILNESRRVLKASRGIILVETRRGNVCLNAGIDKSNVEGRETYCLLPSDPNQSARRIAKEIMNRAGKRVGVVISDTHSRPFRTGQSEFAIGISGFTAFADYRGSKDLFGHTLKFKRVSVADELASAAELVMGQGDEGVPAAIIRGVLRVHPNHARSTSRLNMGRTRDLFRHSL